jgi:hypothetical protein
MNVTHEELRKQLQTLNINKAIADPRAWEDGSPAIILRWGDAEETYTGSQDDGYEGRLRASFADENLSPQLR